MKKLKKPAVLALLAVVLLSCVPERVQAGTVTIIQKDKHTVPEQHGESVFDNEDTLHVTCNSNRVEYRTEKDWLGYNIYAEKPFDYCAVRAEGVQEVMQNYENAVYILMISDGPIDYYQVRDGEYDYLYNTSRTTFSGGKRTGCDGREYYVYYGYLKTATNQFWYNCPETPDAAPLYMPPVISVPTDIKTQEEMCQAVLDRLITGDFSDCRVSEGDADNPAQNAPGGIPGSEDNPEYDKDIGRVVFNGNTSYYPDTYANFTGKNKEYYYNLKWEKETDTGYNFLKSPNAVCKVQFKIEPELYITYDGSKDGVEAPIESKDFSLGSFNASDLNHKFKFYDLIDKYYPTQLKLAESGGVVPGHTPNSQALKLMTFQFVYYARPIVSDSLTVIPNQTSGWKCGDWTRVVMSGTLDNVTTETDPGYFDENGDWHSDGESENIDDGRVPTDGDIDKSIDEYENGENGKHSIKDVVALLNAVSKFPLAFAKMFSFLPDWCLNLMALSFSCMMVVLLIKAVRG